MSDLNSTPSPSTVPILVRADEDHRNEDDFLSWVRPASSFARLRASTRTITLRLPESLVEQVKVLADEREVPYQSLLQTFLDERVQEELRLQH